MHKLSLVKRGNNSRRIRGGRKINSATDLVGESVILSNEDESTAAEIDSVSINEDDSVDMDLSTGEQVTLTPEEAVELMDKGEVESEAEVVEVPEANSDVEMDPVNESDFVVERELVGDDGEVESVATTEVSAANEDEAIEKIKLVDSRRKRNSRNYRIKNSEVEDEMEEFKVTREVESPEGETVVESTTVLAENAEEAMEKVKSMDSRKKRKVNSKSYKVNSDTDPEMNEVDPMEGEMKEFKIQRNCGNGKRKVASVTAPSLEAAMDAVKAKDVKDGIQADGYEELVEKLPEVQVQINSDVEEEIEPEVKPEDKPEGEDKDPENKDEVKDPEEAMRESNSFKGVVSYIQRAYGIDITK